jgi:hypothetical protein
MDSVRPAVEVFQHVRIILGMVVALGMARLLNGLVSILQHPGGKKAYLVHIGWVLTLLLMLVHFWWWQYWLVALPTWRFETYLFLIAYAITLFFLSAFLFPNSLEDYSGYEDFFITRRRWFFWLFAVTVVFDLLDTLIKGANHYSMFSYEYLIRVPVYLALCAAAVLSPNRIFHLCFVIFAFAYEIVWIVRHFETLQ